MLDILTQNPAVWQKTIFVLAYDENDGYFDHVHPLYRPIPTSPLRHNLRGIDTRDEHVSLEQELSRVVKEPLKEPGPVPSA